jgi:hypothetical protein
VTEEDLRTQTFDGQSRCDRAEQFDMSLVLCEMWVSEELHAKTINHMMTCFL